MIIESVDFFYVAMPHVTLDVDGSQDALLVRVRGGGIEGWGECEASPLTSIAAWCAPASHGACQPVAASVLGQSIASADDIARIGAEVARNSMDLLQAAHTWSGVEIALWDLLGKYVEEPVWKLLGYTSNTPKIPYASMLMGNTPQETLERCAQAAARGFHAVKVGWGPYGTGSPTQDADHVAAAREGIGTDGELMIDAGQIWIDDVSAAASRIEALSAHKVTWLEEPFSPHAFRAHSELRKLSQGVGIAGGEGSHNASMAINLIDYGKVDYIQIDAARIGGISQASHVAKVAHVAGTQFVNHTFTSHLALSASMQPFAGIASHRFCEYPIDLHEVARAVSNDVIQPRDGHVFAPDAPGLGIDVNLKGLKPYLREVEITVDGEVVFASPSVDTTVSGTAAEQ